MNVESGKELLEPIASALQTSIESRTEPPEEVVGVVVKWNGTATESSQEQYFWTGQQVYETKDGRIGAVWAPDSDAAPVYISNYNTVVLVGPESATAPLRMVNKAIVRGVEEL